MLTTDLRSNGRGPKCARIFAAMTAVCAAFASAPLLAQVIVTVDPNGKGRPMNRIISHPLARMIGEAHWSIIRFDFSPFCKLLPVSLSLLLILLPWSTSVGATVTVNANQIVTNTIAGVPTPATLSDIAIGMNTSVYYNFMNASYLSPALDRTGVTIVRYPGGNYSDLYHWTNNTVPVGFYAATSSNFGTFVKSILDGPSGLLKEGMVSVNYGASLNDTMGGQPQEAAAWVAYSNGLVNGANATMHLGTDGEGNNWGTVRYWAALRAANPANPSWATDGSTGVVLDPSDMPSITPGNFLKMNRPEPVGVKYWEIGNELNGNGYFGPGLNWQHDRHSLAVGAARQGDPNLSPTFYGQQVVVFADAMKAVDPTIKIGGVLNNASNYDPFVLQAAAPSMDFGIVHYYPNYSGNTDSAALSFLANRVTDIPNVITSSRNLINANAGADASHIPIFITEFGNLGNTLPGVTEGLQTVIDNAAFLKSGVESAEMWEMVTKSFLNDSANFSPNARGSYYAMEALHKFIRPGDTFLSTSSTQNSTGIIYAARRPDGEIALMIINPNTTTQAIPVTINGDSFADSGTQYLTSLTADPVQSTVTGLGNEFTATVPARSIMTFVIPPRLPGDFNGDHIVNAADYTVWRNGLGSIYTLEQYDEWKSNFGATQPGSGSAAAASVPEPATLLLCVVGLLAAVVSHRGIGRHEN